MANKKVCKACHREESWNAHDFKRVTGFNGLVCVSCRECRECDAALKPELIGRKGATGKAKLCPKCIKVNRAKRKAVKRTDDTPKNGRTVEDRTRREKRLLHYVRLERVTPGLPLPVAVIEIGLFGGSNVWSATEEMVVGIGRGQYKNNSTLICGRTFKPIRQTKIVSGKYDGFISERSISRPVRLLRRLGFRVTATRTSGKQRRPGRIASMTWDEELLATRDEKIVEKFSPREAKRYEKISEQHEKVADALSKVYDETVNEPIPDAPSHDEIEAMVGGFVTVGE